MFLQSMLIIILQNKFTCVHFIGEETEAWDESHSSTVGIKSLCSIQMIEHGLELEETNIHNPVA